MAAKLNAQVDSPKADPNGQPADQASDASGLQRAAYDAERAAALPVSDLGCELLSVQATSVPLECCAAYLHAVQQQAWFTAAFPGHSRPLTVIGGRGVSSADSELWTVKIGDDDRASSRDCELACLHELAHIVTADRGPGDELREPVAGSESSRGHHHAWRANFVLVVRMVLGSQAASRLRREFDHWGLPTH